MQKHGKIVATIEARMTSSRLPGKILMPALGKPMLEHLVNRLKKVPSIDQIVLATTTNKTDDLLVQFAKENKISIFRGSEDDVMGRVIGAADSANADIIVEITGDCPILDPNLTEQTIRIFLHNKCDYASNSHIRSYPDGMDVQVLRAESLKKSYSMTQDPLDQEHVTYHLRRNPEIFPAAYLVAGPDLFWPELGLTLDTPQDYALLTKIIEHFGAENPFFTCREAIELLRKNPEWLKINEAVVRKGAT